MLLLSVYNGLASFRFAWFMTLFTALAGIAGAGEKTGLEATAHQNVKRMCSPASGASSTSDTRAASGGMVVYLDEQGRPTQNPVRTRGAVELPAMNQSHEGLVSRTTRTKSGLEIITTDLQGRFQSFAVGSIGPDGKVTTGCIAPGDILPHSQDGVTSGCDGKGCK